MQKVISHNHINLQEFFKILPYVAVSIVANLLSICTKILVIPQKLKQLCGIKSIKCHIATKF